MRNCFENATPDAINEQGQRCLQHALTPRQETPIEEVQTMPFNGHYTDSAHAGNPEHNANGGRS